MKIPLSRILMNYSFEIGPIRPPSEAYSLLLRATRNCPWNRCRFCGLYKSERFQLRSVAEIKEDIRTAKAVQDKIKEFAWRQGLGTDIKQATIQILQSPPNESFHNVALWMYAGSKTAFLQDANTLIMRTNDLVEVLRYLKETLPTINRITSYGRSHTAAKKKLEDLIQLNEAGLSRIHIGLESGYDELLKYMDKGATAVVHITGGQKIVKSGISLSEYVLLGLGGKEMWREHAIETARVLNQIEPNFIRMRTLSVSSRIPLYEDVQGGIFTRQTDEEILEEERLLIENLNCQTNFVSDHIGNLLQELEGRLPDDKERLLSIIERFNSLSEEERAHFIIGRRVGVYTYLNDLQDSSKHEAVDKIIGRLNHEEEGVTSATIHSLMERFT